MPCLPIPTVPLPSLPPGISIATPALSPPSVSLLCCKLPPFPVSLTPVSLGIAVPPPIVAALRQAKKAIQAYLDSLPLDCPREIQAAANKAIKAGQVAFP